LTLDPTLREFRDLLRMPEIDLAGAALAIARIEHPELSIEPSLAALDGLAARSGVSKAGGGRPALDRLREFLFDEEGFRGNADDYYDPRNSCLNDVLERRLGIPITLSVLAMEVGRRVGLEILGLGLPGHFCVGSRIGSELLVLDPFGGGRVLERAEAEAIVSRSVGRAVKLTDAHFAPTPKAQIVVRMLRNLESIYARREDWAKALAVIDRLLVVDAGVPAHLRDRGTVLVKLGDLHRGASEWERYLTRYPQARDAAAFKEELRRVRQRLAERN
jgi:regulator of sirC expression with transglutaminase-like and TPR domain